MADEGNESSSRSMDLNLYLGLPLSPRPLSLELGSDLALSSLPLSSSTSASSSAGAVEESVPPLPMPSALEPTEPQSGYIPSHPEYTPDLPAMLPPDSSPTTNEYTPFFPSYESYGTSSFVPISMGLSEMEGPSNMYSPTIVQPPTAVQEVQEALARVVESHMPYDPISLPRLPSESIAYSPPYVSGPAITPDQEDSNFSLYPPMHQQLGDFMTAEDRSTSRPDPVRCPQLRLRRLIESSNRWPVRRFRSSLAYAGERSSFASPSLPNPEPRLHDATSSGRVCDTNASNKVSTEDDVLETSEEKSDDKEKSAANFECNICLDMATEPVVTSCGHLFCWPCLYQWLHIHSDHKECPVCKGEVSEGNLIPIYGRGNSSTDKEKSEDPESGLKIPPRPRGSRFESFRQQYQPVARRFSEGIASWRRLIDYHMRSRNRYGQPSDSAQQEFLDGVHHRTLSRLRARRLQRELNAQNVAENGELGLPPSSSSVQNPASTTASSIFRDGFDFWHPLSLHGLGTERLAAITADFGRMFGQLTSNSNRFGASTSTAEPSAPEPPSSEPHVSAALAADQISASSTMAVIQGDNATSDVLPDPNSAGTSRSHRRRGRSSSSGSFDVDGGNLHSCKRRRLN